MCVGCGSDDERCKSAFDAVKCECGSAGGAGFPRPRHRLGRVGRAAQKRISKSPAPKAARVPNSRRQHFFSRGSHADERCVEEQMKQRKGDACAVDPCRWIGRVGVPSRYGDNSRLRHFLRKGLEYSEPLQTGHVHAVRRWLTVVHGTMVGWTEPPPWIQA